MQKRFIKKVEDFSCLNCGHKVQGNGFTNHCPQCLWSRHVDIQPGDRQASCRGQMEPIGLEKDSRGEFIVQKCLSCGHTRRNKVSGDDNYQAIIELAAISNGYGNSSR